MEKQMVVLNVRIPQRLEKEIDKKSEELGYPNKSEYVREAIRRMLESNIKETILEELIRRSIEAKFDYIPHEEVVKKVKK